MSSIPGGSPLPPSQRGENAATASGVASGAGQAGVGGRTPDTGFEGGAVRARSAVDGYAEAIVSVAEAEGVLGRVEDELYTFAKAAEANPQLARRLTDPGLELSVKDEIVTDLLKAAHPQTVAAVNYIINAGRARQLSEIAHEVVTRAAARRSAALAEVRTAVPLTDEQERRLITALSQQAGRQIELKVTVDRSIVGGIVVTMGDTVIDGSIARRIADVRARLVGA